MNIKDRILKLKKERNAIILAHNYQLDEVQDIADFVGDSLELSRKAAQNSADVVLFCGVHFMAETASILSPNKTILIPDLKAGCPMADMITAEQLRDLKADYPDSKVICYVNSSAEVKAESDICCTSSNAVEIVSSLKDEKSPPIFVPDQFLGSYTQEMTGVKLVIWNGYCHVHSVFQPYEIEEVKKSHPEATVLAHPECRQEILALADEIASTSGMCRYASETQDKEMIVATENGLLHKLRKDNPGKTFYPASWHAVCHNMKKITLEKVLEALEEMKHEVRVPDEIRAKAKMAVDRMITNNGQIKEEVIAEKNRSSRLIA
jgi:quinolinate synthase